jgi:hypothetical protein
MAANNNPIFTLTPRVGRAKISTANTNLDGTGTLGTVLAAGTNGTTVELVRVKAQGTTTAGMVRIFLGDGTNTYLVKEISVTAITQSGTVQTFEAEWTPTNGFFVIPSGWTLYASTNNAETFIVHSMGGDF